MLLLQKEKTVLQARAIGKTVDGKGVLVDRAKNNNNLRRIDIIALIGFFRKRNLPMCTKHHRN